MGGLPPAKPKLTLIERLDEVARSYEKFLAVHLTKVVQALLTQAPVLCETSGFLDSWGTAKSMKGGVLAEAVRQPLLDLWVKTAEHLLEIGVHQRYPHAHFARHLKDFARLVLSWASAAPEGAEGRVQLLGRGVIPLFFGRLLLQVSDYSGDETLIWRVTGRVLHLELAGRGSLAEISLAGGAQARVSKSRCRLLKPPVVGGAVADIWTREYVGEHEAAFTEESFGREMERLRAALTDEQLSCISRFCRALTVSALAEEWVAGLARLGSPLGDVTPARLVELAHRDCLERLLRLIRLTEVSGPLTVYGNPHTLLVELGARRLTTWLLGEELDEPSASRWDVITAHLRGSDAGQAFLDVLGEGGGPVAAPALSSAAATVPLTALTVSGGEGVAFDNLQLRKTRRASAAPPDWRAIDSLQYLAPAQLGQIYRSAVGDCASSEPSAYCAAISSYILGEFDACQGALRHCLRHDRDVEEYWYLLAFTLRHLGWYEGFNRIVFGGERDPSWFAPLPERQARKDL